MRLGLWFAVGWLTLGVGCDSGTGPDKKKDREPPDPGHSGAHTQDPVNAPAPAPPVTFRREQEMMGTIIQITVVGPDSDANVAAVDDAFTEMRRVEALLSEWQPDSEISRINQQAGKQAVTVSEETLQVIQAGLEVARWSEGAFDLTWAAMRGLYDFTPGHQKVPTEAQLAEHVALVNFRNVAVDAKRRAVKLARPGMQLGTGGIGKGYALDRAAALLRQRGLEHFMIFGGGQIQLQGKKGDRGWRVGIQHPRKPDYFAFLEAEGGSVSTSGDYERGFMHEGKRVHHLLDPKTGKPVTHTSSVTVVAEQGLYADAVSTAIFVLGPERALELESTAPGGVKFIIVDDRMQVAMTPGMRSLLHFKQPLLDNRLP